jgi:hypothetical protein
VQVVQQHGQQPSAGTYTVCMSFPTLKIKTKKSSKQTNPHNKLKGHGIFAAFPASRL